MDTSRNSNLGDWFRSLIQSLKGIKEGVNSSTGQYGGGGVDNISSKTDSIKSNTDTIKSDVTAIKTNTANTKTSVDTVNTTATNIYTLLDNRLVKKLWITRADYDALVQAGTLDSETLYIVIESQSNS